jgi:hypothetical protein
MTSPKSDASRFRDSFEEAERREQDWNGETPPAGPDRHPSIFEFRAVENNGEKSYAALFRQVFEAALERAEAGLPSQTKEARPLAYYEKGRPVIIDVEGSKRYVYDDGSIDRGSTVSPEVEERAFEIGTIASGVEVTAEPEIAADNVEALSPQATAVAEAAGPIAASESIAA